MAKKRIMFYGDSNTYGYDGADYVTGRYPERVRWVSRVARALPGWEVLEDGLNGRRIPEHPQRRNWALAPLEELGREGVFAFMLGTNDVLAPLKPSAETAMSAMEVYLAFLCTYHEPGRILMVAPPPVGEEYRAYQEACSLMNAHFHYLARNYGVHFADAGDWGIELSFDGVHFSARGHQTFATEMVRTVQEIWGD